MARLLIILSDIHANYPALREVVRDVERLRREVGGGPDVTFISLGDVVGYGPQPNECVGWVEKEVKLKVQGNHDREAVTAWHTPPISIREGIRPLTLWTSLTLRPEHRESLRAWPEQEVRDGLLFFHSALHAPDGYINSPDEARETFKCFPPDVWIGAFGHTHRQEAFVALGRESSVKVKKVLVVADEVEQKSTKNIPTFVANRWYTWPPDPYPSWGGGRVLFNPGSVGMPRPSLALREDRRAAYLVLLFEEDHFRFQFRRVSYPVEETVRRLKAIRWRPFEAPSSFSNWKGMWTQEALERAVEWTIASLTGETC